MSELPPGPRAPAAVQTARWLTRPIAFMEECRRRFGDAFSLRFLGFERPMVLLSDPAAIRALYADERARAAAGPHGRAAADHGRALDPAARGRASTSSAGG